MIRNTDNEARDDKATFVNASHSCYCFDSTERFGDFKIRKKGK